jgi:hypothetical protein
MAIDRRRHVRTPAVRKRSARCARCRRRAIPPHRHRPAASASSRSAHSPAARANLPTQSRTARPTRGRRASGRSAAHAWHRRTRGQAAADNGAHARRTHVIERRCRSTTDSPRRTVPRRMKVRPDTSHDSLSISLSEANGPMVVGRILTGWGIAPPKVGAGVIELYFSGRDDDAARRAQARAGSKHRSCRRCW